VTTDKCLLWEKVSECPWGNLRRCVRVCVWRTLSPLPPPPFPLPSPPPPPAQSPQKVECESPKAYQTYDSHKWLDESEWGVKASNWQPNAVWTAPEKPKCKFTPVCSKFLTTRVCSRVCYPGYCAKSVSPSCAVFEKDAFRGVRVSCPVKSTRDVPSWRN
jgi:hypothetical protein